IGLAELPAAPDVWEEPEGLIATAGAASAVDAVVALPFPAAGLRAAEELVFRGISTSLWPVCSPREARWAGDAYRLGLPRRLAPRDPPPGGSPLSPGPRGPLAA